MGQSISTYGENFEPIEKRTNTKTANELLKMLPKDKNKDAYNALMELMKKQTELADLLSRGYIDTDELSDLANQIKEYKETIEQQTGFFVSPDVDKTPPGNIYCIQNEQESNNEGFENNENVVLYEPNNAMNDFTCQCSRGRSGIDTQTMLLEMEQLKADIHKAKQEAGWTYNEQLNNLLKALYAKERTYKKLREGFQPGDEKKYINSGECSDKLTELQRLYKKYNDNKDSNRYTPGEKEIMKYAVDVQEKSMTGCTKDEYLKRFFDLVKKEGKNSSPWARPNQQRINQIVEIYNTLKNNGGFESFTVEEKIDLKAVDLDDYKCDGNCSGTCQNLRNKMGEYKNCQKKYHGVCLRIRPVNEARNAVRNAQGCLNHERVLFKTLNIYTDGPKSSGAYDAIHDACVKYYKGTKGETFENDYYDEAFTDDEDYDDECLCNQQREGFVSNGGLGANYNKDMDTITGPALFTNQILQNGTTWKDLTSGVEKTGIAQDGPNKIGAGPGNSFDSSMKAHIRNMEIMASANNEYNTPQMLKEINKNINKDISGGTNTSLYNRGAQTKGKIIQLNDKAVGVLPEEFYPERAKNRNIYKTQEIIPIAGFNINEARIGENFSEIHPVLYLNRSHRRMATAAGTGGRLEEQLGKIDAPIFDSRKGRTGNDRITGPAAMDPKNGKEGFTSYDEGAKTGEDNFKGSFKAAEGGNYWMPKRFQY